MAFSLNPMPTMTTVAVQVVSAGVLYNVLARGAGPMLGIFPADPILSVGTIQQGAAVVGVAYGTCYVVEMLKQQGLVA